MADKAPEEIENNPESKISKISNPETSITSPVDQKSWHQSQEAHYIPEDESATHIALRPDQLKDLQNQGLAEKFEIVGMEAAKLVKQSDALLDTLIVEGESPKDFVNQVKDGLRQIPDSERQLLKKFGVKVVASEFAKNHSGTPAYYLRENKNLVIGMKGTGTFIENSKMADNVELGMTASMITPNQDVSGSVKHEVGHALFHALNLNEWREFQNQSKIEKSSLTVDDKEHLAYLLESDTELFAEIYAAIRNRQSDRITRLKDNFPKTKKLVTDLLIQKFGKDSQ